MDEAFAEQIRLHTNARAAERAMLEALSRRESEPDALVEAERLAAAWAGFAAEAAQLLAEMREAQDEWGSRRFSR